MQRLGLRSVSSVSIIFGPMVRSVLQFGKECVADAFLVDAAEVAQDVDGAMLDKAVWNT